jgi:hypothetical protein
MDSHMTRFTLLAVLLASSRLTLAAPCDRVSRGLTDSQKDEWSSSIARQLGVGSVLVRQVFGFQGWKIVYVETPNSDPPFLFYHGNPAETKYTAMWSGAAGMNEEGSMLSWTSSQVHGIPATLAKCFAWHVTNARDQ